MPNLKKSLWAIIILVLVGVLVWLVFGLRLFQPLQQSLPRIIELERYRVRVLWTTNRPAFGTVWYSAVSQAEQSVAVKGKDRQHLAEIGGLMPETVYNYRLLEQAQESYSFKTAPLPETAFRFLIYQQDQVFSPKQRENFIKVVNEQLPDFIILSGNLSQRKFLAEEANFFNNLALTTRLPIFLAPAARELTDPAARERFQLLLPKLNNGLDYVLDYGNSRLVVLNQFNPAASAGLTKPQRLAWLRQQLSTGQPLHRFIISSNLAALSQEDPQLYQLLLQQSAAGKIDAVFSTGTPAKLAGTKVVPGFQKYLVLDIDGAGVTGTATRQGRTDLEILTIKETPEAVKRSCIYCRKLLETQRYQESIDWYRKFINQFGARYMVDDAQFEIANIYDQYLFDYPAALREYRQLIAKYPDSSKTRQSRQRIEYIETYQDHNYQPLRIFEKAKSQTYQRNHKQAVAEVESILAKYPGAKLEPQALYWLGYTLTPTNLERAAFHFRQIIAKYPGQKITDEAWVALGDAYYQHRKYHESIEAYRKGIESSGEAFNFGLEDKIRKSFRNILRISLAYGFTLVVMALYLLGLLVRPRGVTRAELKLAGYLFLGYLAAGTFLWGLRYRNYPELIRLIPFLALAVATAPMITAALARKLLKQLPGWLTRGYTLLGTLLLTMLVIYVFLYYYYSHYLVSFGL